MEITIFTLYSNRPDFIKLQKECFRSHLKDDYKWVIVNNRGYFYDKTENIEEECFEQGIECLRIEHKEEIEVSQLVANSLNFLWREHISKLSGLVIVMDSDLFLTSDVSFVDLLGNNDIFFCPQYMDGHIWPWPGLMGFNMDSIKAEDVSFSLLKINDRYGDVGSGLNIYIEKHKPKIRLIERQEIIDQDWPVPNTDKTLYQFGFPKPYSVDFLPFAFHYKTGSNYAKHCTPEYNEAKTKALLKII